MTIAQQAKDSNDYYEFSEKHAVETIQDFERGMTIYIFSDESRLVCEGPFIKAD